MGKGKLEIRLMNIRFMIIVKIKLLVCCIMVFILYKTDINRQSYGHLKLAPFG